MYRIYVLLCRLFVKKVIVGAMITLAQHLLFMY